MFNTKMSQKGKVLALFVILSFAIAGLAAAVTFHSEQYATAQSPQFNPYDPNNCFGSNVTKATCPTHSNSQNQTDTVDCFKKIEETVSGTAQTENYTKSVQNFNSLIPTNNDIALINTAAAESSQPVKDMDGVWDLLMNQNMTRYDRQLVLDQVNILLTEAKPGFTTLQNDQLSLCITTELNSLGPTLNY
jgi:hypothetical protein